MDAMRYVEHVADLVGQHPAGAAGAGRRRDRRAGAGQGRVLQPRRQRQGPHRAAHGRGRRGVGRAAPRRHDRRADVRQHRRRAGDRGPAQGLPVCVRLPGQGGRGQAQRARGLRRARSSCARPPSTRTTPTPTTAPRTGSSPRSRAPGSRTSTRTRRTRSRTTSAPARSSGSRPTAGSRTSSPGIGTGGTISGVGRYLKEVSGGRVQVIGADPEGSVYSGGTGRPYLVEGVGEDFWPTTYDKDICDRIVAVSDADSFAMTRRLAREEALLVGGSCGMATVAALRVAAELPADATVVVVLLPDGGRGYLGKVFNDAWMAGYGFLPPAQGATVGDVLRRKDGADPGPRARPPQRDGRRRRALPARVRRLADAGRARGAAGDGRRGGRGRRRARPARRPVHRPRAALGPARAAHVARRCPRSGRTSRWTPRCRPSRRPTRRWCSSTASPRASSPARTCWRSSVLACRARPPRAWQPRASDHGIAAGRRVPWRSCAASPRAASPPGPSTPGRSPTPPRAR